MMERQKWVDHVFQSGLDPGWTPNVMTRVADTVLRLHHHCDGLSDEQLSMRINETWSMKEHIGHLIDLEDLHHFRLAQFPRLPKVLKAADMSNAKTHGANYNAESMDALLKNFRAARQRFISAYGQLDEATQQHQAMHPRLNTLMRPVDLLFFMAEHDDHHITSLTSIKTKL